MATEQERSPEGAIRVLLLEDSPTDAELVARALDRLSMPLVLERVDTPSDFERALQERPPDLILADNSIPGYRNADALKNATRLLPGVPFIFVSGTIGEDRAIERLKEGATDYVLKDNLARLGPAVRRALEEARHRRERSRAEETLRSVLGSALDAIVVIDPRGRITSWNHEAERTFGWKASEVLGQSMADRLIPPDLREGHRKGVERYFASGEGPLLGKRVELRALRKDGSELPVELAVVPIRVSGEVHFGAFIRDLTEKRKAEGDQALLAEIVRSSQDAIHTKTLDGRIMSWNRGAEELFGYSAQEAIGQPITLVVPEDRRDDERRILERIARGERVEHLETVRRRKDGSLVSVSITVSPVRDREGRVVGSSNVTRDISERVRSEAEVRQLNETLEARVRERTAELEDLLRHLDAFSYSVAHDLRAPLRAIRGFTGILREDYAGKTLDAGASEWLAKIEGASARMNALIEDLLGYSRLAKAEVPVHAVPLGPLVAEVLSSMADEIRDLGGSVTVQDPLPVVRAHAKTLAQALSNLVSNALKFVSPGTRPAVRISAVPAGDLVRVRVEDNGIGIAPEDRERLFQLFARIHPEGEYPGTGMGLAIVKMAAERMGGRVGLESERGKGSAFWIELPRDP